MNGRKKIIVKKSGSTGYYVAFDLLNRHNYRPIKRNRNN